MDPPPPSKTEPEDKSERYLTKAEIAVLQQISALVKEIAEDGSLGQLALKGPLGDNLNEVFINRFKALPGRLEGLMKVTDLIGRLKKIKVSGQLPAGHAAKTDVKGTNDDETVIWLAPLALLPGQTTVALTSHVLTVIHELTHALEPKSGFPVKDYAYQDSWAYGFLPPEFVTCNADSYRHLAFMIVSQKNGNPRLYAPRGQVPRQRDTLRASGLVNLSNALALANIRLDRAWIRALDCQEFAESSFDTSSWNDLTMSNSVRVNDALLRKIEDWLREKKIVGERNTDFLLLNTRLTEQDKAVIKKIYEFLTWVKGAMYKMTVALSESGAISYNETDRRLTISYSGLEIDVKSLAGQILSVISDAKSDQREKASSAALGNVDSHRVELIFALSEWDRPDVREKVDSLCNGLTGGSLPVPGSAKLAEINTEMALAALESRADDWQHISSEMQNGIYHLNPSSKEPDALTKSYTAACGALKYLDSLPGRLTDSQAARRRLKAAGAIVSCAEQIEKRPKVELKRPQDDLLVQAVRPQRL